MSLRPLLTFLLLSYVPLFSAQDPLDNYTDWAINRGDKKGNQFSELAYIHAANVHKLAPAWEYHTGDAN